MSLRSSALGIAALALAPLFAGGALAQDSVKIGLILPMTGPQASTGKQIDAAVKLYMQQHGSTVAGKKIEVVLKDVSIDDAKFGVKAIGNDGGESLVSAYIYPPRQKTEIQTIEP